MDRGLYSMYCAIHTLGKCALSMSSSILQTVAMSVAAFASGGAALIAKIFLALVGAVRLVRKIVNVIKLEEMEENM